MLSYVITTYERLTISAIVSALVTVVICSKSRSRKLKNARIIERVTRSKEVENDHHPTTDNTSDAAVNEHLLLTCTR